MCIVMNAMTSHALGVGSQQGGGLQCLLMAVLLLTVVTIVGILTFKQAQRVCKNEFIILLLTVLMSISTMIVMVYVVLPAIF